MRAGEAGHTTGLCSREPVGQEGEREKWVGKRSRSVVGGRTTSALHVDELSPGQATYQKRHWENQARQPLLPAQWLLSIYRKLLRDELPIWRRDWIDWRGRRRGCSGLVYGKLWASTVVIMDDCEISRLTYLEEQERQRGCCQETRLMEAPNGRHETSIHLNNQHLLPLLLAEYNPS